MNCPRLLSSLLALSCAVFLSGCLGYEEEMTINNDLSGTAKITVTLPDKLDSKLSDVGDAFTEAALTKRFDAVKGVTLVSYTREKDDTRQPQVVLEIKFSSLDALSKAAEANPPAAMLLGKFEITKDETGGKRITRKLGTIAPKEDIKEESYAQYVMHFGKALGYTNSTRFDGANDTVRFRYKMETMPSLQPEIITVVPKPDIWKWLAICFGSLAVVTFLVWQIYGQKK